MKSGTPIRDHVMTMTNYFTKTELHGTEIDLVTQVGIILNFLSTEFIQFTFNYIMNKLNYNISQLLNELQIFKSISRLGKQIASVSTADKLLCSRKRLTKNFTKKKVRAAKPKAAK